MPALEARPQMDPAVTRFEAFFTTIRAGMGWQVNLVEMFAGRHGLFFSVYADLEYRSAVS